jgi:hypothetical protein
VEGQLITVAQPPTCGTLKSASDFVAHVNYTWLSRDTLRNRTLQRLELILRYPQYITVLQISDVTKKFLLSQGEMNPFSTESIGPVCWNTVVFRP